MKASVVTDSARRKHGAGFVRDGDSNTVYVAIEGIGERTPNSEGAGRGFCSAIIGGTRMTNKSRSHSRYSPSRFGTVPRLDVESSVHELLPHGAAENHPRIIFANVLQKYVHKRGRESLSPNGW